MAKFSRKQYIVKKDFQLKIFFETVIFLLFVAVLVGFDTFGECFFCA